MQFCGSRQHWDLVGADMTAGVLVHGAVVMAVNDGTTTEYRGRVEDELDVVI